MPDGTTRWQPPGPAAPSLPRPKLIAAMMRGVADRCPICGTRPLFEGWLRVRQTCSLCGTPLGRLRADDAPPYVVIFLVGHAVVALLLLLEAVVVLPVWLEAAIFLPLTAAASLALLRPVKGAVVGLMLALGMMPDEESAPAR